MENDHERRIRDLEEQVRKDHDLLERAIQMIKALRTMMKADPLVENSPVEIIQPVNTCKKCLDAEGRHTYHIFVNGVPTRCECVAVMEKAEQLYKQHVATAERRKQRQESILRKAAARDKTSGKS